MASIINVSSVTFVRFTLFAQEYIFSQYAGGGMGLMKIRKRPSPGMAAHGLSHVIADATVAGGPMDRGIPFFIIEMNVK